MTHRHFFGPCLLATAIAAALSGCASTGPNGLSQPVASAASARPSMVGVVGTPSVVPYTRTRDGLGDANRHYDVAKYWLAQGRSPLALEALDRALAADRAHVESLNARASIRAANGDFQGAQKDLQEALTLAPERAHLHYNLGVLKRMQQDPTGAQAAFQQALIIDPSHQGARAAVKSLPVAAASPAPLPQSPLPQVQQLTTAMPVVKTESSPAPSTNAVVPQLTIAHAALVTVPSIDSLPARAPVVLTEPASPASLRAASAQGSLAVQRIAAMPEPATTTQPAPTVATGATIGTNVTTPAEVASLSLIRLPTAVGAQLVYPQQPATDTLAATDARIDIANGNGVNGLAKALRTQLRGNGLTTASISNWSNFDQRVTRVYYREGFEQTAQALARKLPVNATVSPLQGPSQRDVVVVLGSDMRSFRLTSAGWVENTASLEPGSPALGG